MGRILLLQRGPIQVIQSGIWKLNVISSLPSWMKSWVYSFLNWVGIIREFREAFIFDRSRVIINSLSKYTSPLYWTEFRFCLRLFPPKKFNSPALLSPRYQTKGCLIAGILLNSVTWCFRRWISRSTHSLISVSAFAIMSSLSIMPNACNPLRNGKLSVGF